MDYTALARFALFAGLSSHDIEGLLVCTGARERTYEGGETILHAGEVVRSLGLVLAGSANVVVNHYGGGRAIFGHLTPGQVFAETYSAIPGRELLVDVVAEEPTRVLYLNTEQLLRADEGAACAARCQVVGNLVRITAERTLALSHRMIHIAPKTIRERVLSYLGEQAACHGSARFTIPFSRQQLADYLGVDRSALSAELSRMQRDGLIVTDRSRFELIGAIPCEPGRVAEQARLG